MSNKLKNVKVTLYKPTGKYYTEGRIRAKDLDNDKQLMHKVRKANIVHNPDNFIITLTGASWVPRMINQECWMQYQIDNIGTWAEKQFDKSTPESIVNHLKREIKELEKEPSDEIEMADIIMLIFHLAYKLNRHLWSAISMKFSINKNRKWGPVDEEGVSEHIE